MLITIVVILLLIGAAVVGSIYSNFLVFYNNFSESENYHKAYYAAISALERGELVTKQHSPGYTGSGGREQNSDKEHSLSDKQPSAGDFSYFSKGDSDSTVLRNINSRTTRIPTKGNGDVEPMLAYSEGDDKDKYSENYNMMDYEDAQIFLLYYDKSYGDPYKKVDCSKYNNDSSCEKSSLTQITGQIRLPPTMSSSYGQLDTNSSIGSRYEGAITNDPIVDRQIRGNYNNFPFTIFSTESATNYYESDVDSVFREKDINSALNFKFSSNQNPKPSKSGNGPRSGRLTVVSNNASNNASSIEKFKFSEIFNHANKVQLRFSLLNLLKGSNSQDSQRYIYPFLEYYVDFGEGKYVSDRYFTINAEGYYGGYKINKIIWKPTVNESVLSSFTSIFK